MLYDAKGIDKPFDPLVDLPADPLPTRTWARVAGLLDLPPEARPDFERLWVAHRWLTNAEREMYEAALGLTLFVSEAEESWGLVEGQQFTRDDVNRAHQLLSEVIQHIQARSKEKPPRSHQLVQSLARLIKRYTGKRPHHGEKWLDSLTAICREIDPEITKWTVQGALHPRRPRRD